MKKALLLSLLLIATLVLAAQVPQDTGQLRQKIKTEIVTNGSRQITGLSLNNILIGIVDLMKAYAIDSAYRTGDTLYLTRRKGFTTIKVYFPSGSFGTESDPTVSAAAKSISATDKAYWNNKQDAVTAVGLAQIVANVISVKNDSAAFNAAKLRGNPIASTTPALNQVLKWDGTAWAPANDSLGAGGGGGYTPPGDNTKLLDGTGAAKDPATLPLSTAVITALATKLNISEVFTRTARDSSENASTTKYSDRAAWSAANAVKKIDSLDFPNDSTIRWWVNGVMRTITFRGAPFDLATDTSRGLNRVNGKFVLNWRDSIGGGKFYNIINNTPIAVGDIGGASVPNNVVNLATQYGLTRGQNWSVLAQRAADSLTAIGGGIILPGVDSVTHDLPVVGSQKGIQLRKNVLFDGRIGQTGKKTKITFIGNCAGFSTDMDSTGYEIDQDITDSTTNTIHVFNTTGLVDGGDAFLRLGTNPYDLAEPQTHGWFKILSHTSNTITLDRPVGGLLTVAGTSSKNRRLLWVRNLVTNAGVYGFEPYSPQSGSAVAEAFVYLQQGKDIYFQDIDATNMGAGAMVWQFGQHIIGTRINTKKNIKAGNPNFGRGSFVLQECVDCHGYDSQIDSCQDAFVVNEAGNPGSSLERIRFVSDSIGRKAIVSIGSGNLPCVSCTFTGKDFKGYDKTFSTGNLELAAPIVTKGTSIKFDPTLGIDFSGNINIGGNTYRLRKQITLRDTIPASGSVRNDSLPSGFWIATSVKVSNASAISNIYYFSKNNFSTNGSDFHTQLVSNKSIVPNLGEAYSIGEGLGNAYLNKYERKGVQIDGTPGTVFEIYMDFFEKSNSTELVALNYVSGLVDRTSKQGSGSITNIYNSGSNLKPDFYSLPEIKQYIAAQGVSASTSVSNYPATAVDSVKWKWLSGPLVAGDAGGWLGSNATGDSILVTAPFGVIIGNSIAEGHPGAHGRLHAGGSPVFDYAYPDVNGQMSYMLRQLTHYRWYNHGIGGQTSTQIRARFYRDALGLVSFPNDGRGNQTLSRKPMVVVIDAGVNNISDYPTVMKDLEWMAATCQQYGIKCVIMNICGDQIFTQAQNRAANTVNKWLASGALDQYGCYVWDYNKFWNDPAYGGDNYHGNYLADDIHLTAAGYDSAAVHLFNDAKLPVLTKAVVINEISPTTPLANFARPTGITINSNPYTLSGSTDSINITTFVPDSVWIKITASTTVAGAGTQSGFSSILWKFDNNPNGDTLYTKRINPKGTNTEIQATSITLTAPDYNGNPVQKIVNADGTTDEVTVSGAQPSKVIGGSTKINPSDRVSIYGQTSINGAFFGTGTQNQLGLFEIGSNVPTNTGQGIRTIGFTRMEAYSNQGYQFKYWGGSYGPSSSTDFSPHKLSHGIGDLNGDNISGTLLDIDAQINNASAGHVGDTIFGIRYRPTITNLSGAPHIGLFIGAGRVVFKNYTSVTALDTSKKLMVVDPSTGESFLSNWQVPGSGSGGGTPTYSLTGATGAGTGATASINSGSKDEYMVLQVFTGTSPAANGLIATINLSAAYPTKAVPVISPGNAATADAKYYVASDANGFTIVAGNTALTASTSYTFFIHVKGY